MHAFLCGAPEKQCSLDQRSRSHCSRDDQFLLREKTTKSHFTLDEQTEVSKADISFQFKPVEIYSICCLCRTLFVDKGFYGWLTMSPEKSGHAKMMVLSMNASTKRLTTSKGRVSRACEFCRSKKKKCDGQQPCDLCKLVGNVPCVYLNRKNSRQVRPNVKKPVVTREALLPLPEKETAIKLIHKTWDNVCVLFRFLYRPAVIEILSSLYEVNDPANYTEKQIKAQPLIYSVIAVGALFAKEDLEQSDVAARDFYQEESYKYFLTAKSLVDIANVNEIYAMQTMFMLTMFLQCSANLKTCYSYIGIALRAAISEGLHRKNSLIGPTPIEDETKKRLFWSVYKVDLYMNCILGLPRTLSESAINQELPRDVDDEKITTKGILAHDWGKISSCGMNNQHTKLMLVMARIHESLYPVLKWGQATYVNIINLQDKLNEWFIELPMQLKPDYQFFNEEERNYYLKPNKLLYLDYLLAKIILYKPFIHYLAINSPLFDFQISMANYCIQVAHEVISLSNEMLNENLLSGSYWFSIHTIFFSVTCLMFYQHLINLGLMSKDSMDVERDCDLGIEILLKLKNSSAVGERSFNALNSIFKEFNKKTMELYQQVKDNLAQIVKSEMSHEDTSENSSSDVTSLSTDQDEYLDQLLQDFDIPVSNILPDFQMTSFFPPVNTTQVAEKTDGS